MRVSSAGKGLRQTPSPRSRFCEHISADDDKSPLCRQRIYVTCPHCQRSLCLHHINEHQLLIRSMFDSLVDRLNEHRYALANTLSIPPNSRTLVDSCLDEFKNVILPYVQRTCGQNDVKQDDVNRIQIFSDKMFTIIQHIQFYWENDEANKKRPKNFRDKNPSYCRTSTTKRARIDTYP